MAAKEMPIFVRTFDFLTWLLPISNRFPKPHRHTYTSRLLHTAFDLLERLEEANNRRGIERLKTLKLADEVLGKLRIYLRMAAKWGWLSEGQYQHVAAMVVEIGRLLGSWLKMTEKQSQKG